MLLQFTTSTREAFRIIFFAAAVVCDVCIIHHTANNGLLSTYDQMGMVIFTSIGKV